MSETCNVELANVKRYNSEYVDEIFTKHFGDDYINYRKLWKKAGRNFIPDFPVNIDIEVIDDCNFRCKHCYRNVEDGVIQKVNSTGIEIDMELYNSILDEGYKNNLKAINLGFSGECLLNKNIIPMIKQARSKGVIDIRIITNGSLLSEKMSEELLQSGITFLSVSIDAASDDVYYKLKGKHLFQQVTNNLKRLYEIREDLGLDIPLIRASFYSASENRHEESIFIEKYSKYCDFIDIQPFSDFGCNQYREGRLNCLNPFRRLAIFADGKVAPCSSFFSKGLIIGNVKESSLKELWYSDRMQKIHNSFIQNNPLDICRRCFGALEV